jgi:hypothetical protein
MIKAQDYAQVQMYLDGVKVGGAVDLYNSFWVVPGDEISLGTHHLGGGQHKLAVEIVGANPEAKKDYLVGVDYLRLSRAPRD